MVIDKVEPSDLQNLSNAALLFNDIVGPRKTEFLFPSVWKILSSQFDDGSDIDISTATDTESFSIPTGLTNGLSDPDVFNMRLVSKTWCASIDLGFNNEQSPDYVFWSKIDRTNLQLINHTQFLTHFSDTHPAQGIRSPFICKSALLSIERWTPLDDNRWFGLLQILSSYGHHLQKCTVSISDAFPSRLETYSRLHQVLGHLPNLTNLEVKYTRNRVYQRLGAGQDPLDTTKSLAQFQKEIKSRPLPRLELLTKLTIDGRLSAMVHELIERNDKVTSLNIKGPCPIKADKGVNFRQLDLSKVTTLSLRINSDYEMRSLEQSKFDYSATQLKLKFDNSLFLKWPRIFKLLQKKWGNSLETLDISLPSGQSPSEKRTVGEWSLRGQLNLEKLETLKIRMRNIAAVDFIAPLKELKQFDVKMEFNVEKEVSGSPELVKSLMEGQKLQFLGFNSRRKLAKSNIWGEMGKLERLWYDEEYEDQNGYQGDTWLVTKFDWKLQEMQKKYGLGMGGKRKRLSIY